MLLTDLDSAIIKKLQDAPFSDNIFTELADQISISLSLLLERLRDLKERGIIRRWGVYLNSRVLGYKSALLALRLPEKKLELLKEWVKQEKGVTHCYTRRFINISGSIGNHELTNYNIWLTLTCLNSELFQRKVNHLQKELQINDESILILPAQKKFKLRVDLED